MKRKFKKSLFAISGLGLFSVATIASACGTQNPSDAQKIIFQSAQGAVYPLTKALITLAPLYNDQQKNSLDFLPVEFQPNEVTKAGSEAKLAANVVADINTPGNVLPNIILNNQGGAFLVNQYGKLLNLDNSSIKSNLFLDKLVTKYNQLSGQSLDSKKLYNIPFDVTDTDALGFNLDIMWKLFELIENNGGQVDHNMVVDQLGSTGAATDDPATTTNGILLYQAAKKASTSGSSIPKDSAFNALVANSPTAFKDINVNAQTFANTQSSMQFAKDVFDHTHLDPSKLTAKSSDIKIFGIDYQENTLAKSISNKIGGGKFLWSLKSTASSATANTNQPQSIINYDFTKDNKLQKDFTGTWDTYVSDHDQTNVVVPEAPAGTAPVTYNSTQYMTNANSANPGTWLSWDFREYNAAFGYVAAVGVEQSMNSPTMNPKNFGKTNDPLKDKYTSFPDVYYGPQVMKSFANNNNESYLDGGSSLVALTTDNGGKRDKATIKFLEWLYTGNVTDKMVDGTSKEISVSQYLINHSGYVLPLKTNVTSDEYTKLTTQYADLTKMIDELQAKNQTDSVEYKAAYTQRNYLRSAIVSLQSMLHFNTNQNTELLNYAIDATSQDMIDKISSDMLNYTLKNPSPINGQDALGQLTKLANGDIN
ncbi:P68 family surface lipoprotein [[Mycoplasma] testudinis]|uniref:P68 family surface lipoprotein n=1 Tax=[Mycoplasma] testudinis TaxID=33924 RepID=UPI00069802E5|nr:hypothetical protein [[Mycoplasma] testudinis]